jgi:UDP-GlcNAc:undecaprenyl-phosphate GlcNAc-1-phosphate transferase
VIAFGAVSLTLFNVQVAMWGIGIGLVLALAASAIPRLRESARA